jgi:hypothetical protein
MKTGRTDHGRTRACRSTRLRAFGRGGAAVAVLLAAGLLLATMATSADARSVMRGLLDDSWTKVDGAERVKILREMSKRLHVQVLCMDLIWASAEPNAPGEYDQAYLDHFKACIDDARRHGIRVVVSVRGTPTWAADTRFAPPNGQPKGAHRYDPVKKANLGDWERSVEHFVTYFRGKVTWWECWNEPNLWGYLYPQRTASDPKFAARRYMWLLKRFYRAVKRVHPGAKVLAGVTAPVGTNDRLRTSPQRFARLLKSFGAARYFDGYSHHPYMPANRTPMIAPEKPPRSPKSTVSLGNIKTLLRVFPKKPFFLTEYGYPTRRSRGWGVGRVSRTLQARYLTRAYKYAARYRQVKMLVWFLWKDINPTGDPNAYTSAFFGLRSVNGQRKPSWYAFARLR